MEDDGDQDVASDLYALIVHLHISANRDLFDAIGVAELSFSQAYLLERLRGGRWHPTIRQASELMHLSLSGGSRVVGALCKRGLIRRQEDERDYRATRITITDRGEETIAALHAARLDEVLAFVNTLDAEEREELGAALHPIVARAPIAAHRPEHAAA